MTSESEDGPESEERELTTPYPLEGKYTDELDRERYYPTPLNNTPVINSCSKAIEHVRDRPREYSWRTSRRIAKIAGQAEPRSDVKGTK